ncbi:MAG: chromosome partition protein MukE [Syntrophobacteraceae bacterium]|jgi:chromosome partition protein MukE|nr:chromosome partition protein MukE [Syntrophobacteraceae bacterium]
MHNDNDRTYHSLDQVILDPLFPGVDHRLRTGGHIDMDDIRSYEFLLQAEPFLQVFYEGYDCRLVNGQEGYFYLLSEGDLLGHRRLSGAEMLVGQVLALLRMDPAYLKKAGQIPVEQILSHLEMLLGRQRLAELLAPRTRGRDAEMDNKKIREAVDKAINGLARLGFITIERATESVIPGRSIARFTEPVRDAREMSLALEELIKLGEVELDDEEQQNEN